MRTLLIALVLACGASNADAGFFKKWRERRQGTSCTTGDCSQTAASNGPSFTSVSGGSQVVCNAKGCQVVQASATFDTVAPFGAVVGKAPDTIVIDGRSYRLTPIGPP